MIFMIIRATVGALITVKKTEIVQCRGALACSLFGYKYYQKGVAFSRVTDWAKVLKKAKES
jgi:hypothetical protein